MLDTEYGPAHAEDLMHTVSFYRKSKPVVQVNVTPHRKIVRNVAPIQEENQEDEVRCLRNSVSYSLRKVSLVIFVNQEISFCHSLICLIIFSNLQARNLTSESKSCKRTLRNRCNGDCKRAKPLTSASLRMSLRAPASESNLNVSW